MPAGFQLWPEAAQERFGHYVEPVAAYFPPIGHATPSWSLAVVSTLVALGGAAAAYRYYFFVRVRARSRAAGQSLTELPDGPTAANKLARAGHRVLADKYYFDHLYTGIVAGGVKGPAAKAAYWTNQKVIDAAVDGAGRSAVAAGRAVYDRLDQGVHRQRHHRRLGRVSDSAGESLRGMQTGKVQQYAAILFAAAAVLAGVFIVVVSL